MPKISVVMPLYNAENYVAKAVQSILQQTFREFELLIIDDCGQDRSLEIVSSIKDSRIRILKNDRNRGIAFSRNRGIEEARGEYIALMDDDDLAPLYRLKTEIDFLEKRKDIDAVGGSYGLVDKNDSVIYILPNVLENPKYIRAALMFYDPIGNGTAMLRKKFLLQHQIQFQDHCLGMEDYRFWVDCSLYGTITNLNEVLLYWRQAENETTRVLQQRQEERAQCFRGIQKYALIQNGFHLTEEEFAILADAYVENYSAEVYPAKKLEKLYGILWTLVEQAKKGGYDNYLEVKILCRKLFERRMEFSELWCK